MCRPIPASKGGTESSVKIGKADLVPTDTNLREEYALVRRARGGLRGVLREGQHPGPSGHPPATGRDAGRGTARLHPVAASPHTVAFGTTRVVPANTPMVTFESGQYSVPHQLLGATVWVRVHGVGADEQVVIVHVGAGRAGRGRPPPPRHPGHARRSTTSTSRPQPAGAAGAAAHEPKNAAEAEFLALGEGARLWLIEAAAAGTTKMRVKMAEALALAKLFDPAEVDWALGHAAVHGRFAEADLASILDHHAGSPHRRRRAPRRRGPLPDPGHQRLGHDSANEPASRAARGDRPTTQRGAA